MPELILFVGLPGSGKSTFYREKFSATHVRISKDEMPRGANKARRQREALQEAFAEGRSAVLDNTSVSREERAAAIEVAQQYGAKVIVFRFAETVADCRTRNALREGASRVPLVAIYTAAKRYEEPLPNEGIDRILLVRIDLEGFTIEDSTGA